MSIFKNILLVLLFVLIGVAAGSGLFLLQKTLAPSASSSSATASSSQSKTTTKASVPAVRTYQAPSGLFSFVLPSQSSSLEETVTDPYGRYSALHVSLVAKKSDTAVARQNVDIYSLDKSATTSLASATQLLKKSITQSLTLVSTQADGAAAKLSFQHSQYRTAGQATDLYEEDGLSAYVFVRVSGDSDLPLADADLQKLLSSLDASLQDTAQPVSAASPSTGGAVSSNATSSLLLNQ